MSDLRECPFCGKTDTRIKDEFVWCRNIKCPISYVEMTIKEWNTREADATIAKVLEECKEWERKAESMENMETISSVYYLHTARSIRSVARCIKRIIERGE